MKKRLAVMAGILILLVTVTAAEFGGSPINLIVNK